MSYFLRTQNVRHLMQMGRWFGYRPGYIDLCRLYTTTELADWFGHIADAAEELREEFDLMAASGATPREYGLKVQSHPVLLVTSRLKMRSSKSPMLSFSGQVSETITLFTDPIVLSFYDRHVQPVIVEGGRTNLVHATLATPDMVLMSLERLNRLQPPDTDGMTVEAEAGVRRGVPGARRACPDHGRIRAIAQCNLGVPILRSCRQLLRAEADFIMVEGLNDGPWWPAYNSKPLARPLA